MLKRERRKYEGREIRQHQTLMLIKEERHKSKGDKKDRAHKRKRQMKIGKERGYEYIRKR